MSRQTIVECLCRTKNLAARHLLQDEAARLGAQGMISEELDARLALTEASGLLNEAHSLFGPVQSSTAIIH
jgi:hypothetical protein